MDDLLLDRFDISLLVALQKNSNATHQQLGELIHLSTSQVSRRIQRLQACGIIRKSVALLDPTLIGLGVRAVTYVTLTRHSGDEGMAFEREIAAFPEVLECFSVTGESDYILQIMAASLSDLSDSVLRRLTRIKGVSSIRSNIVLQSIKSTTELPLDHIGRTDAGSRRVRLSKSA
ncbi:Lrp/AsnC family transcriptional regulator [Rhodoferax aquaticus]|uniref:Lrp/AsnC family transcriptional regulator n=1 Tax=Rhodoferax aquaticus TaxID=2527691 RepID=A0A515EVQ7_9BURK|nr:Lrp/AsnC family transcriptional regulator [Rhodoferax aquaticus]